MSTNSHYSLQPYLTEADCQRIISAQVCEDDNEVLQLTLINNNNIEKIQQYYRIFPASERSNLRSIKTENILDDSFVYRIIEKPTEFLYKTLENGFDFSCCIFLESLTFLTCKVCKQCDFSYSIFTKEVKFASTDFSQQVIFSDALFSQDILFSRVTFAETIVFNSAKFLKQVNFINCRFIHETSFKYSRFLGQLCFNNCAFNRDVNFQFAQCIKQMDFYFCQFSDNALVLQLCKIHQLSLTCCQLTNINYDFVKIDKFANRLSALTLKNIAINQNDRIAALDFHAREMRQHLADTPWRQQPFDYLLLTFEAYVSDFGTSVKRALGCYAMFLFLLFGFTYADSGSVALFASYLFPFDVPLNTQVNSPTTATVANWTIVKISYWHYPIAVLHALLLYEVIKSLRKYSRSL